MADQSGGIEIADWRSDEAGIRRVRNAVFTIEQGIDPALDFDGEDAGCVHVVARGDSGEVIGTARMQASGKIGRIAVLSRHRSRGIGRELTRMLIDAARDRGQSEVYLHAQARAAGFYENLGFERRGEPFLEVAIKHVKMVRKLKSRG